MKKMKLGQVEKHRGAFQIPPRVGPDETVWVSLGSKQEREVTAEVLCRHETSAQGPKTFWDGLEVVRLTWKEVEKQHKGHPGFITSDQRLAELQLATKCACTCHCHYGDDPNLPNEASCPNEVAQGSGYCIECLDMCVRDHTTGIRGGRPKSNHPIKE